VSTVLEIAAGTPVDARLDHAVIVVPDLDRAEQGLAALGLDARGGGRHDGHGTRNVLVPLTAGYLELITVEDPELAEHSRIGGDVLRALHTRGGGLLGYAVEPAAGPAGQALADRIAVGAPLRVARTGPDGVATGWTMRFADAQAMAGPLPFLIAWDQGPPAPAAGPGRTGVRGFRGVRMAVEPPVAAWYRELLAPALGAEVRDVHVPAPDPWIGPLASILLDADEPDAFLAVARRADLPVDGGDVVLPAELFGPGVRLTPRLPAIPSTISPRTDTPS
jgi:hypothetical protein